METVKKKVISWLISYRKSFLTKSDSIFYIACMLISIALFGLYFSNLNSFALSSKSFTFADGIKYYPSTLLTERFSCSENAQYLLCGIDVLLFLLLLLVVEIFTIRKVILLRKKVNKLPLFLHIVAMQVFIAILGIAVLGYTPEAVVANLSRKARAEIKDSIVILNNPVELSKTGVKRSVEEIANKIKTSSLENFSIAESNPHKGAVLSYLKIPKKGKDTLYRTLIIPYQLSYADDIKKTKLSFGIVLFPDNTLVINKVDKKSIEQLVPVMANKMVAVEFKTIVKQKNPNILFLGNKEYNAHQKKQEEKLKKELQDNIAYLESYINESDGKIKTNQAIINSYFADKQRSQQAYDDYIARYGGWYAACKRDFGDNPECEAGKSTIDASISNLQSDIRFVDENRNIAEQNLKLIPVYKNEAIGYLAAAKKNYQDFLKFPITAEFQDGVFNAPDIIYIRFYDKENKSLSFYLDTTLHEYLHFYSYSPDNTFDTFLDEGFTDYLKLAIASKYLEPESQWLSYPNEIGVIDELTKYLPKERLIQFYLDKNKTAFQRLFVETYSPLDYENFILKGKNLSYAPIKDEKLKKKYLSEIKMILKK